MKKRALGLVMAIFIVFGTLPFSESVSAADETLFERFIPINQAYSTDLSPFTVEEGSNCTFFIGTSFRDENKVMALTSPLKRKDLQGYFFKLNYRGTFGSLDKEEMMSAFSIRENDYLLAMGDPSAEKYANFHPWIHKDAIIISIDLYDQNKQYVQNLSPASAIMVTGPEGEFVTCSMAQGYTNTTLFSTQDNILKGSDDIKGKNKLLHFTAVYTWLSDKGIAEGLIGSAGSAQSESTYEFIQYPETTGKAQYMTNNILSVNEFISPDNTYYQVGHKSGEIDPVVMNKIENVVDYSEYGLVLSPGYTRRSILTADGTLYGVTTQYEKAVLATNVKQAGKAHYLTANGEVKEIVSGKTIATDCKEFAEHRYATVIGVLKNDNSFWLGYTYLGEENAYKKGLEKKLDNAKAVVAGGVCDADNNFYRWQEDVIGKGYDKAAWSRGEYIQYNEYKLSLDLITGHAVRVFPNEYFTTQYSTAEEAITGFVVNEGGDVWAFGMQYKFYDENLGLIKHIFPIYQHKGNDLMDNGNFVGLLPEDNSKTYGVIANHCSSNRPVVREFPVDYLSDVPGGFKALDGYTYAFDNDANDGTAGRTFRLKPTEFHYLNDGSEIFKALNTSTNPVSSLYLLPNVARSSYKVDGYSGNTVLLERTDGSMWMTQIYPRASASNIVAKLGGWECSNAIQITQPTTKRTAMVDYVDLVSGGTLSTLFNLGETVYPEEKITDPYIDSEYYTQITSSKVDQLVRESKPFLLLICKTGCNLCTLAKPRIKTAIEREQVPIYGCIDDYSRVEFYWDYVKGNTVGTPLLILFKGEGNVEVKSGAYTQSAIDEMVQKAKGVGASTVKTNEEVNTEVQTKIPSDKISVSESEWEVLKLVNRERFQNGLHLLTMPGALQSACNTRENELATLFSHTRPNGEQPFTAISSDFAHGYAGENIAAGQPDAAAVVTDWMNSPGHRANILNVNYGYIGIGCLNSRPLYWVQLFSDVGGYNGGYTSVTTSTGRTDFDSETALFSEYLVCTDKNGVESYLSIDPEVMTQNGNSYTVNLYGKAVTLTVGAKQIVGTFEDVKTTDWFANAVKWAVDKNITAGTSATTFSPTDTCTRAQILTFLWRAVGSPKQNGVNPFADVQNTDYFYDAALWANAMGMVSGNSFEGNTPCTRSSTVTYLWKNAGSPSAGGAGSFSDVPADSEYAQAVAWALAHSVTSGTSETTFSPDDTCTRGQIVTFLNRTFQ